MRSPALPSSKELHAPKTPSHLRRTSAIPPFYLRSSWVCLTDVLRRCNGGRTEVLPRYRLGMGRPRSEDKRATSAGRAGMASSPLASRRSERCGNTLRGKRPTTAKPRSRKSFVRCCDDTKSPSIGVAYGTEAEPGFDPTLAGLAALGGSLPGIGPPPGPRQSNPGLKEAIPSGCNRPPACRPVVVPPSAPNDPPSANPAGWECRST